MTDQTIGNNTSDVSRRADEVFCELGRFVVKFEHVVQAMATTITFILAKNGLENQQLAHIMLAEQTAQPIKSVLQAMVGQVAHLEDGEKSIADGIFKRVQDLIERRNLLVHSFTAVGPNDGDLEFIAHSFKLSRGRSGSGTKGHQASAAELRELCDECTSVEQLIDRILIAIMSEKKFFEVFTLSGKIVALKERE